MWRGVSHREPRYEPPLAFLLGQWRFMAWGLGWRVRGEIMCSGPEGTGLGSVSGGDFTWAPAATATPDTNCDAVVLKPCSRFAFRHEHAALGFGTRMFCPQRYAPNAEPFGWQITRAFLAFAGAGANAALHGESKSHEAGRALTSGFNLSASCSTEKLLANGLKLLLCMPCVATLRAQN